MFEFYQAFLECRIRALVITIPTPPLVMNTVFRGGNFIDRNISQLNIEPCFACFFLAEGLMV
jgi:hypothetical protein